MATVGRFILFPLNLFAIITILISEVKSAPSASTSPLWRGTYTQSSYWYSDYAIPKSSPKKAYLPGPQFCPETGRTICAEVKPFYPVDEVFDVISAAKAKRFNISSEFVDESQNDDEPHFNEEEPVYESKPKHEGYVVYQTAVHYDYNNNNSPNYNSGSNYNHPTSPNYATPGYSSQNSPQGYTVYDNMRTTNRGQFGNTQMQRNNQQTIYPYGSHYAPIRYPNDNNYNVYQQQNYQQQPYQNEMISQQPQSRYKRQVSGDVDPVCPSRMILVEPKAALNDKSQWKFVVNLADKDPRLKQAIKVEVCTTPNQPCSNQISLPFGFVSRCKQKYIKKKLLSLDSSGQSISSENFFAPSCCVCEVVRNTNRK